MTAEITFDTPAIWQELATTAPAVADAPQVASLLFDASMTHAHGPLLTIYIQLLDEWLRTRQATSRADRLHLINLRHALLVRREAEELADDAEARRDTNLAATRFARKAQSGIAPSPFPPASTRPTCVPLKSPDGRPGRRGFLVPLPYAAGALALACWPWPASTMRRAFS